MKRKTTYYLLASFALLIFVILGYVVRFYPQALTQVDTSVQSAIRGSLPASVTQAARTVTVLGNTSSQIVLVALVVVILLLRKRLAESIYMLVNGGIAALLIVGLKNIYQRPRPSISHLVEASGYSFPSGHSLGSMVIFGTILIVLLQQFRKTWQRTLSSIVIGLIILIIGLSRIYLGVHYPSDVLAGFVLGFALLMLTYPTYDRVRFRWRFYSRQH